MRGDSGEENARGHDEGQRDDVRRVFEYGAGTWDKRVRGDAFCGRLNAHAVRVRRIVIGMLHPNMKFHGNAIKELIEKSGFEKKNRLLCAKRTRLVRCVRGK